jgi:hypothetical protein
MENKDMPAFPDTRRAAAQSLSNQAPEDLPTGLTKREYFAAMALQGILANPKTDLSRYGDSYFGAAKEAILFADELLQQLSTPQP